MEKRLSHKWATKKLLSNIMLQNELESEAASFITTFKLVLQQASWVNTNF